MTDRSHEHATEGAHTQEQDTRDRLSRSALSGHDEPAGLMMDDLQGSIGNSAINGMIAGVASRSHDPAIEAHRTVARSPIGAEGGPLDAATSSRITSRLGSGSPLDGGVQQQMEGAFGTSFAGVGVHTDAEAHALNREVSAVAFTVGQDIFFQQGAYQPHSSDGQKLLAHELTHVVQQGPASAAGGPLTVGAVGDRHEQEAEATSNAVSGMLG